MYIECKLEDQKHCVLTWFPLSSISYFQQKQNYLDGYFFEKKFLVQGFIQAVLLMFLSEGRLRFRVLYFALSTKKDIKAIVKWCWELLEAL